MIAYNETHKADGNWSAQADLLQKNENCWYDKS